MIRVIIVDDHTIVRKGIQQLLEETDDIRIQGEAHHAAEDRKSTRLNSSHYS